MSLSDKSDVGGEAGSVAFPFVDLKAQYERLRHAIDARLGAVLEHGRFILGPEVTEFEGALAAFAGCRSTVGVASGSTALLIALMAEEVGPGDAVFLPSFTFTATAEVPVMTGATPVFVDVHPRTFNIDPADLERRIEETRAAGVLRPRAVMVVDLFGLPADYPALGEIAARHGLFLLADAAQSLGGALKDRRVGTLAPVTAVSFFPSKPLGCYGDGGALLTDDEERAHVFRSIRDHGRGGEKYDVVRLGLNGRLDTLQAAVLLAKLEVLDDELKAREALARHYDLHLGDKVGVPLRVEGTRSAWAQYTILLDERDRVQASLARGGIPTRVYYPRPMHLQPANERFGGGPGSLPVSEELCRRVLSLPMHPYLDRARADRVAGAVMAAL